MIEIDGPFRWEEVTLHERKAELFEGDPHLRRARLSMRSNRHDIKKLQRTAFVVIRPEALDLGGLKTVAQFLQEHEFDIVSIRAVLFDWRVYSDVWRYQLSVYSAESLITQAVALSGRASAVLVLKDRQSRATQPASVRLQGLKGSALTPPSTESARIDTIRGQFQGVGPILKFVHIADEPIDILRESSIYEADPLTDPLHFLVGNYETLTAEQIESFYELLPSPNTPASSQGRERTTNAAAPIAPFDLIQSLTNNPEVSRLEVAAAVARSIKHPVRGVSDSPLREQFKRSFEYLERNSAAFHFALDKNAYWLSNADSVFTRARPTAQTDQNERSPR